MKISAQAVFMSYLLISTCSLSQVVEPVDPYGSKTGTTKDFNLFHDDQIRIIIRLDDAGFCHAANMALEKIAQEGCVSAVSVIVNTPWLDEAVAILKRHPQISVGLHSCLNSEWKPYRWGPVLPVTEVPTLIDKWGKFHGSVKTLIDRNPDLEQVDKEIRAQVELALRKGLNLSYIDHHMSAAVRIPGMKERFVKIAEDYQLGISRWFGEIAEVGVYSVTPELKAETLVKQIRALKKPGTYLVVCHPGLNTPEMSVLEDLNVGGLKNMSLHREAETLALCNPELKKVLTEKNIQMVGYDTLKEKFLNQMQDPGP